MAAAPRFKVYDAHKQYIAACKHAEDAAALAALHGDGSTVRDGHALIVWTEGAEEELAGFSYDNAARIIWERIEAHNAKTYAKYYKS